MQLHDHTTVYPFLKGRPTTITPHARRERDTKRALALWILEQEGGSQALQLAFMKRNGEFN